MNASLIDKSNVEIKLGEYRTASATALEDVSLLSKVQDYRRQAGARMVPIDGTEIDEKVSTAEYYVSRKIDGEFTVLVYRDGECVTLNPGGKVRIGMPWQDEACKILKESGLHSAVFAGELYAAHETRRTRVHDVTSLVRQPNSIEDLERLRFAVFDVLSINEEDNDLTFAETWRFIENVFSTGEKVHPVESVIAKDSRKIERLFEQWVEGEGAEGMVARSDLAGTFKIKPRHNLDAVVIGFTDSTDEREGMLHDLLLAVMRHDGVYQVLTRVGGGFSDDQRRELLSDLKDRVVESEYAEVNSDHVAYRMVRPEMVVEISYLDLISETTRGGPVNRMVLNFKDGDSPFYEIVRRMPLAAVISPQFVRIRDDKQPVYEHVRIEQASERVEVKQVRKDASQLLLPKSEVIRRDVYTKEAKGQTMVRKFVTWKTNKDRELEEYPAFVHHYTDFSPNRKSPLDREVRISNSQSQILQLHQLFIDANIKKGWELHSSSGENLKVTDKNLQVTGKIASVNHLLDEKAQDSTPMAGSGRKVETKKATKKKTTKKKAARKKTS